MIRLFRTFIAVLAASSLQSNAADAQERYEGPIIDMHMHAYPPDIFGSPVPNPISGLGSTEVTEEEIRQGTLEQMRRHKIVLAVLSGPPEVVARWKERAPGLFLTSPHFPRWSPLTDIDEMRGQYEAGVFEAMGEISSQYSGMEPADKRLEPYVALAEELGIPFGLHVGLSGRGVALTEHPDYRIGNGRPLLLEPLIIRHPDLRLYVMHAGWPFLDEMKAILWSYPHVYVDISPLSWFIPTKEFHTYLRALVEAGFDKQIMFGSDQMIWPDAIGLAIEAVQEADYLTHEQKADIFYNNAARFLELSGAEITTHKEITRQ
ncbi:amidohydrolase family protein [Qipengyuania vesicularis]|uniref:amidohydrolase family protein n=1 Tax=Qipengyuania vesicularis TaxID=2867232 RepID=UPI001C87CB20|nr:amidohydrolase family protein [Qipengyuania vesicularis]MBX7527306.1 amidohydrolase family protein [Qipengyuania vesicularis]